MIVLAIVALVIAAGALSLAAYAVHAAISATRGQSASDLQGARWHEEATVASLEEQRAREEAAESARGAQAEKARADYLEEELTHVESNPVLGSDPDRNARARLRRAVSTVAAAVRRPSAGSVAGEITVPDTATPAGSGRTSPAAGRPPGVPDGAGVSTPSRAR